jgi:glutamate carboxypeptidase
MAGGLGKGTGARPSRGGPAAATGMSSYLSFCLALERLQDLARDVSVSVNLIRGGTRTNVVADDAQAEIDVRATTLVDAISVESAIRSLRPHLPGTSLSIVGAFDRPPLERTVEVARLCDLARRAAAELGMNLAEGSSGGGSNGNFTAALGVPTRDGLGAVGDDAHALHGHVDADSLTPRAALAAGLMARIAEGGLR